jgi:adenosine deaminase
MQFADLSDFLRFLDWSCSLVLTADQLTEAAYASSRRMAVSGAGYADIIVNPTHWTHWHRRVGEMIEALDRGFAAAEHDGLPSVGLCVSLLRTQTAAAANVLDLPAKQVKLCEIPLSPSRLWKLIEESKS